jgi:hypothetical protein
MGCPRLNTDRQCQADESLELPQSLALDQVEAQLTETKSGSEVTESPTGNHAEVFVSIT